MPFSEISDPNQLAVLLAVLNEICLAAGIEPQSLESEHAAGLLIHLHRIGCHSADELKATFEGSRVKRSARIAQSISSGACGPSPAC
jgi:hypothetical protein